MIVKDRKINSNIMDEIIEYVSDVLYKYNYYLFDYTFIFIDEKHFDVIFIFEFENYFFKEELIPDNTEVIKFLKGIIKEKFKYSDIKGYNLDNNILRIFFSIKGDEK